jgi:hypothetical protein
MGPQTSTDYSVDNRYRGLKGASDDAAGKSFLHYYVRNAKKTTPPSLAQQRSEDDRVRMFGLGGTVPVGALGLGQQIGNTDAASSSKNPFVGAKGRRA